MKLFKKLTLLGLALLTTLSAGIISACDDNTSSDGEPEEYVCRVKVENATGYGFQDVVVGLYDGDKLVREETTAKNGYVYFTEDEIDVDRYTVRVSDIPTGYVLSQPDATYQVEAWAGFEVNVELEPTGLLMDTPPRGTSYSLGDVMYDFILTTSDGETFTLSEVLKEKELVLINFWATWCSPCKAEFPAMNNAYVEYQEKVEVLAISTTNTMQEVKEFKSSNGIKFKMTSNSESGANLVGMFNLSGGIPVSVMVDRYGVVTYNHTGSMTSAKDFTSRFDRFLGTDYKPTILVGAGTDGGDGGSNDNTSNLIKPTVSAPSTKTIKSILTPNSDDFTFAWDTEDEYAWPWLVSENKDYLYSPIAENSLHSNYSTLKATFTAAPGDAIFFDYLVNSEKTDILHVLIDGVPVHQLSGGNNDLVWKENFGGYLFKEGYDVEGEHEIIFLYIKDSGTSVDRENACIKNLRIVRGLDNTSSLQSHVFRHAANVENADKENRTALYKHYADVVYNEADGYYHVGSKNGPLLLANMMLSSRWSDSSLWILAYNGYVVSEGYNFSDDIEDHAWAASQYIPDYEFLEGYTPVTEDLKQLLISATKSEGIAGGEGGNKKWDGKWHDKEWLELCAYYDNYGVAPMKDHMETITFHAAKEISVGENTANVLYNMVPRGFKYKFIPEASGVYNVYSDVPLNNAVDPACFFFGESTTEYRYYDEQLDAERGDGNFNFHVYLEQGKTYYFAMATYGDTPGSYPFHVDYVGTEYKYMENCATIFSFNEITNELFLYDGIEYMYSETDDRYYTKNADGSKGSMIYADMLRTTMFFNENSLFETARADKNEPDVEKRNFYIDGVDYTDIIFKYGSQAFVQTGNNRYFVPLNKELFEALDAITMSTKWDGIVSAEDSWQMLCYYEVTLKCND